MNPKIISTIKRVRRRLQFERIARGVSALVVVLLLGSFLATYLLAQNNFSDVSILWIRVLGILISLGIFAYYIFLPLWSHPSIKQVARFMEERYPQLEERISTTVMFENHRSSIPTELRQMISRDANKHLQKISPPRFYYPRRSLTSLASLAVSLVTFAFLFLVGPEVYPYSIDKLLGLYDNATLPLYFIEVTPGDITVGKHADQEIRATLHGFDAERVRLAVRYANQPQWEETTLRPDPRGRDFVFIFFDIRDPIEYYVTADGIQSGLHTINVSKIPRVENLTITLNFPDYTGLQDVTLDNGNIRALTGTEAHITIQTDQPIQNGIIQLETGTSVDLNYIGPRELNGKLSIAADDYYRIHLQDQENSWNPASDEYMIEALEDQPPIISFSRPGRDRKVSNIEEVFTEIRVEDDYGVEKLSLHFSPNGEQEREIALGHPKESSSFSTSHTFYLEEFDLEPGDFLSYWAEAHDAVTAGITDIYFLEVEPFDRRYYQSQQSGTPGGGNGNDMMLSRRQKDIVAATFKLERDKNHQTLDELEENGQTLALIQQRLQSEAQTIVDRMGRRVEAVPNPHFKEMIQHLKQAISYMEPAQLYLSELKTQHALPEAQKALQQLLRAESLFKDMQVSFAQNRGGGGASAEDLADLVDLELDRTKNQYETLQQNREIHREQALDEALEKLKELARRQNQMVERHRQQSTQGPSQSNISRQELIEEVEQMARELERLSREQQKPALHDISRSLQRAVQDMRQSQSGGQKSLETQRRAQQALTRLREAEASLGQQRQQQVMKDLHQLKTQSQNLVQEQKEVLNKISGLDPSVQNGRLTPSSLQQLRNTLIQKADLQENLHQLEGKLHQSARQIESNQEKAARILKQSALDIRDQRIPEKMMDGSDLLARRWVDLAEEREEGVLKNLEKLAEGIQNAENAIGLGNEPSPQEKLQQAFDKVGPLVGNLESLHDRATGQQDNPQNPQRAGRNQLPPFDRSPQDQSGPQGTKRNNPRQLGQEWRERMEDAIELQNILDNIPDLGDDATSLIKKMRQLDAGRIFSDQEELAQLKLQIIDGFRQLELEINRLVQRGMEQLLHLVGSDEIPPEFREQVEQYYRNLANRDAP
ncbi:MAG: DUF4175 family protein [Acidobacteriota bacterium]|nr:DUF4175 family protein [Acidobacteriota bacterium]